MIIRIQICPTDKHSEPLYYQDVELPLVPPLDMFLELGELENGDLVAGHVVRFAHRFTENRTEVTCQISDDDIEPFAKHNGWTQCSQT